jgi:hypothetical protein
MHFLDSSFQIIASSKDDAIETLTGISREQHENRNAFNELPTGKLHPAKKNEQGSTSKNAQFYLDEADRLWRRTPDLYSMFHQPFPVTVALIRSIVTPLTVGLTQVPYIKLISPNAASSSDNYQEQQYRHFSEIVVNRYTGELIIDPQVMGTYNLCAVEDVEKAMRTGATRGEGHQHTLMDVVPHVE